MNAVGGLLLAKMTFANGRKLYCDTDFFGYKCKFGWQVEDVGDV